MEDIKKFEGFLDRMQGLLDNAKKQGRIIVSVEDLENAFPEPVESDDRNKPNGGIVMEDFNEGNGFYKVNLSYLNEEQVKEIEGLVKKWNPELKESEGERIRKALIRFHKSTIDVDGIKGDDIIAWLEKQDEQKPAWSEEDEKMYAATIFALAGFMGNEDKLEWLKSIKDRVQPQPKQEWKLSEEEKAALRTVIHIMTEERSFPKLGTHLQNILNAFEGQSREEWKPSDEQMEALDRAQAELCSTEYNKPICDLIDNLKKLKE